MNKFDSTRIAAVRIGTRLPLVVLLSASLGVGPVMAQVDAALDRVDPAEPTGHLDQAQQTMRLAPHDHPDSAKAHFSRAQLLMQQNLPAQARDELGIAERLAPGLPFAQPGAVRDLRRKLDGRSPRQGEAVARVEASAPKPARSLPWGVLIAVAGGAFVAWGLVRIGKPAPVAVSPLAAGCAAAALGPQWSGVAAGADMVAAEALGKRALRSPMDAASDPHLRSDADLDSLSRGPRTRPAIAWRDFDTDGASTWDARAEPSSGERCA